MILLVDHELGTALTIQMNSDRRNSTHRFGYSNEFVSQHSLTIHKHTSRNGKITIEPSRPKTTTITLNTDSDIFVRVFTFIRENLKKNDVLIVSALGHLGHGFQFETR